MKITIPIILALGVLLFNQTLLLADQDPVEGGDAKALHYDLGMKAQYTAGDPIIMTFTLDNQSGDTYWVLTWYTPLEGMMGRFLDVSCDQKEILYEGPMVKRAAPGPADYQRLAPGESVNAEIDLAQYYDLPLDTPCRVNFSGTIHDLIRADRLPANIRTESSSVNLEGPSAEFIIKPK